MQQLTAATQSYVTAETANVSAFTANPVQSIQQAVLGAINAASLALTDRPLIGNGANGAPGSGANGARAAGCSATAGSAERAERQPVGRAERAATRACSATQVPAGRAEAPIVRAAMAAPADAVC